MEAPQTPITLTDKAAAKILEIRAAQGIGAEKILRLAVRGGGCAGFSYELYFDDLKPDIDERFALKGVEVAIDTMSLVYLAGTELDFEETPMSAGFKFKNPNVKSTCGCGSSFST